MNVDPLMYQISEFTLSPHSFEPAYIASKIAFLDYLGCCFAAHGAEDTDRAIAIATKIFSSGICVVPSLDIRLNAAGAAWLGSFLGHYVDFDDVSWTMRGHPTTVVLPAAWAIALEKKSSGRELIEAQIIGSEVAIKLGCILNPSHYDAGWHTTGTLGIFGATAACVRLLEMSISEAVNAFGIAASMASGLKSHFGSSGKAIQVANACKGGVFAAECGRYGMTSGKVMSGPQGFLQLVGGADVNKKNLSGLFEQEFEIVSPGLMYKLFPCCARLSTTIKEISATVQDENLSPEKIHKVVCRVDEGTRRVLAIDLPKYPLESKFSIPWAIAIVVAYGWPALEHFSENAIRDMKLRELAKKVTIKVVNDLPPNQAEIIIEHQLGSKKLVYPVQDHDKVTIEQIEDKFKKIAKRGWNEKQLDNVIDAVYNLENNSELGAFSRILSFSIDKESEKNIKY